MKFDIITLFPEMFEALNSSITGRALRDKLITLRCWNPRDYTTDTHRTVDDRPYGGGPGMVMKVEPLQKAIAAAKIADGDPTKTIYLSPQGKPLTQTIIRELASTPRLTLVSGRYEGIDERLIEQTIDAEYSIGDYVLSGGELPAMVLIDALTRLLPGALGHKDSAAQDSFSQDLLDHPHYTRPEILGDTKVPKALLSGDHAFIARWRLKQAIGKTWQKRPDLLKRRVLTAEEKALLDEFIQENAN
jgi:tRNA (guanine37-N1)-methyltransferase